MQSQRYQAADIFDDHDEKLFLLWVGGLIFAYIICCCVNVTLDMILGIEDILISWFVISALLGIDLLFVCCMIHCKHLH